MDIVADPNVVRFQSKLVKIFEQVDNAHTFINMLTRGFEKYKKDKNESTNTCLLLSNHIKIQEIFSDPNV